MSCRATGAHGVRFTGTRLAISQDRDIVALYEGVDTIRDVLPDAVLSRVLIENMIEEKAFAALVGFDGKRGR